MLVAIIGLFATINTVSAQTRTKIADGLTLVRYGNTAVLEDEKNQKTWNLSATREQKSTGEWVYTVACEGYTRVAIQGGLQGAISYVLVQSGVGAFWVGAVNGIAAKFYQDVCDYYK